jgi:murein DD-endopeptidase MepM/ murein hydrolase activator NlpD
VDFQRRVRPGDSFEVFYSAEEETGGTPTRDDILYAALTVNGETRRYFRFRTEDDGLTDFFDERGRSAKKFLMRTPINGGAFRSGFGFRRHPLLGYTRMHTGVDWSAPTGTPIMAAGAGTVIKAEWVAGYGRRVEVQHSNGYVTSYSHMSGFGRNIQRGTRVTQGQVIGFLGSSGLSTGPHLHYEVAVNGSYVDPMRIRVPRGRVLEGRMLAEFERERLRVEQMIRRALPSQIARNGS